MSSILITTPTFGRFSAEPRSILAGAGEVIHPHDTHPMSPGELLERVPRADALIVGMDTIDTDVLDAGPRLRVIAKHGVGVDTIDVAAARQRGIRVVSAPGSNARAVPASPRYGGSLRSHLESGVSVGSTGSGSGWTSPR